MCWQCKVFQSPANCDIAHICSPHEDFVHFADNSTLRCPSRNLRTRIWGPKRGAMFPMDMALATDLHRLPQIATDCHGTLAPWSVDHLRRPEDVSGPGGGCDLRYVEYGRYDKAWGTSVCHRHKAWKIPWSLRIYIKEFMTHVCIIMHTEELGQANEGVKSTSISFSQRANGPHPQQSVIATQEP